GVQCVLFRSRATFAGFAHFYPYAVYVAWLLLAWRFQRSRLFFSMLLLALASFALLRTAAAGPHGALAWRVTYQCVAVLLPLDLAALALFGERGVLTRAGVLRFVAIAAEVALVITLVRRVPARAAAILQFRLLPGVLFHWTPPGQPALAAPAAAGALPA